MEKHIAEAVRRNSLHAVESLSRILEDAKGRCSPDEFETLKKGVGLAIGKIQVEILNQIYREYPELDDLR